MPELGGANAIDDIAFTMIGSHGVHESSCWHLDFLTIWWATMVPRVSFLVPWRGGMCWAHDVSVELLQVEEPGKPTSDRWMEPFSKISLDGTLI
jgi:hypothetical protein